MHISPEQTLLGDLLTGLRLLGRLLSPAAVGAGVTDLTLSTFLKGLTSLRGITGLGPLTGLRGLASLRPLTGLRGLASLRLLGRLLHVAASSAITGLPIRAGLLGLGGLGGFPTGYLILIHLYYHKKKLKKLFYFLFIILGIFYLRVL